LNCGHPFFGHEKFCPECGQKNKGSRITMMSFLKEVFNGFISWDAKFWTTMIPLLTKPGKVSRDFIEGKRARYSNPFQFYLSISIVFFLILGLANAYQEFRELSEGRSTSGANFNIVNIDDTTKRDSILNTTLKETLNDLNPKERAAITNVIPDEKLDSIANVENKPIIDIDNDDSDVGKMMVYQRAHPFATADEALDSLKIEKGIINRFLYSKARIFNAFQDDPKRANEEFAQELVSYASISLFIFLPIFTLFLKLFYIRRKFTYVEHLIFVFHTQTVFFILLTIFFIISLFAANGDITWVFSIIFLIYLFIAMKRFYKQGYIKTFFKFLFLNFTYFILGIIGFTIVGLIAFAFY
jgi:hypothetical protein